MPDDSTNSAETPSNAQAIIQKAREFLMIPEVPFQPCPDCTNVPRLCDECFERIAAPARAAGMSERDVAQLRARVYRMSPEEEANTTLTYISNRAAEDRVWADLKRKAGLSESLLPSDNPFSDAKDRDDEWWRRYFSPW